MNISLSIKEAYVLLSNLEAREQWLNDNPNDESEIENEKEHIANIIIHLKNSATSKEKTA